jgi:cellulose synthase/poly-beta-1,6-N-acetylglucosamine synthase-like glycosyltransferase
MTGIIEHVLLGFDWMVLAYFVVLNTVYLLLICIAAVDVAAALRRLPFRGDDDLFANPFAPGISVIVPARNEEAGIVESVRALLNLRYPVFEVIVVDDGSTDGTFERLRESFGLVESYRMIPPIAPTIGRVHGTFAATNGDPLTVVRKDNAGRRSDPINVGLNVAQFPLVCMVDADSILDETALLRVAKPFVDDPDRVVATGGVVRAANGSTVHRGRVTEARLPDGWLARIQVIEYLRSFLLGRTGWSRLGGLVIISGAFGLFRRDLVLEIGGLDLDCIGEDAELVVRLHRHLREQRRPYRIVFVPEPVSWTEVPSTSRVLARQRRRWSLGLAQVLSKHRTMICNPRYGRIGMVVLPYYVAFELLGPVVELTGLFAVGLALGLGLLNVQFAVLFALASIGYGTLLSLAALVVEEFSYHRYERWRDLATAVVGSLIENLGYRQMHSLWRLRGLLDALRRRHGDWGTMTRIGFATAESGSAGNDRDG